MEACHILVKSGCFRQVCCGELCLLFVTPWTVTPQVLLSMEFSRQEYWSGLPFSSPGDLPDPITNYTLVPFIYFVIPSTEIFVVLVIVI